MLFETSVGLENWVQYLYDSSVIFKVLLGVGSTALFFCHIVKFLCLHIIRMYFCFFKKNLKTKIAKKKYAVQKTKFNPKNHQFLIFCLKQ